MCPLSELWLDVGIKEESAESNRREEGAISSGLADSLANVLTLTVRQDQEIKLSPSQVCSMTNGHPWLLNTSYKALSTS